MGGQNHQIVINVTQPYGSMNFTFRPSRLRAHPGDCVQWVSEDGPFAVEFIEQTPGNAMGASGHTPQSGAYVTAPIDIRDDARGRFQYAVAVSLPARDGEPCGRVALDAGCPEIIVD